MRKLIDLIKYYLGLPHDKRMRLTLKDMKKYLPKDVNKRIKVDLVAKSINKDIN